MMITCGGGDDLGNCTLRITFCIAMTLVSLAVVIAVLALLWLWVLVLLLLIMTLVAVLVIVVASVVVVLMLLADSSETETGSTAAASPFTAQLIAIFVLHVIKAVKTDIQISSIEGRKNLVGGRLETDVTTAKRNRFGYFSTIEYSADSE
uniref:Uncharacterized protein n=1 Tax=Glossina brevipalpis TaxID=37001 RepID=A0A1A9WDY7_9MUSC